MKREKIRLVWLVIVALSLSWAVFALAGIGASEELTKKAGEEQLDPVEDMAIIDMYYKRGIYGNDEDYVNYAKALLHFSKEEFAEAIPLFEPLADDDFLDCDRYAAYANGRKAEAEGDIRGAAAYYMNLGFLDSDARWMRLMVDVAKKYSPMLTVNSATGSSFAFKAPEKQSPVATTPKEIPRIEVTQSPSPTPSPIPGQVLRPTPTPVPTLYFDLYLADESTIDIAIKGEDESVIQYVSIHVIPKDASEWTVNSSTRRYVESGDRVESDGMVENGLTAAKQVYEKWADDIVAWVESTKANQGREAVAPQGRRRME